MVQQHVPFAYRGEDVGRGRRLDLGKVAVGAGDELRVLQLGPVQGRDAEQSGEVQRAGQRVDLGLADLQLPHQQVQYVPVDRLLDLQPHRRPEPAPHQLLLQRLEEVLRVVLLDLQVLVAGEAEGVVLQHLHPREQLLQVRGDDVLDGHVPLRGGLQEAGEQRRHLDAGEVPVPGDRVADDDGQVEGEPGDVRERVRGVDRQRSEHGEDAVPEEGEQARLLLLRQLAPAHQVDALVGQGRGDVLVVAGGVPGHELAGAGPDHLQHLAGLEAGGGAGGDAGGDAALEARDPDHEELVQVAGEDREEVGPLQQGRGRVLGEFEHPFVEREPAALPVQEAALGQLVAVRRVLVDVEIGIEIGFQIRARGGDRVRAVRGEGPDGGLLCVRHRCLGVLLAHGAILPRTERNRRVGNRRNGRWEGVGGTLSPRTCPPRGGRRGFGHGGSHWPSVARPAESLVTAT